MSAEGESGILYVVATPIGNLEDITYRAVRILGEADWIACEDTRHSRKLLDHYGIHRPTLSYYRENEAARSAELLQKLRTGAKVALISDAGTPLLSDPGQRLVQAALDIGLRVIPIPGPSAALTALMAGGVGEPVALLGFLPARGGERRRFLQHWVAWPGAFVIFEAPHRLAAALADLEEVLGGERLCTLARELTKVHEEFTRGTLRALRAELAARTAPPRGEFTLVLAPGPAPKPIPASSRPPLSRDQLKKMARERGVTRSALFRAWQEGRVE
ncbi:MAG: 16S rRNA (cytidine(1402)-2'-O)-methyltransferase [Terriglobales bacterium]